MKRLFVLGAAIMAFGASLFASGKGEIIKNLDTKETQKAVVRYLDADFDQELDLGFIFSMTQKKYDDELAKGETEDNAFNKAIGSGLLKMRDALTTDQYQKFRDVLAQTIRNSYTTNPDSYYVNK